MASVSCFAWVAARVKKVRQERSLNGEYKLGETIGLCDFGEVAVAQHVKTRRFVAVKIVLVSTERHDALRQEVCLHRRLDHPNVARLFDVVETPSNVFIMMELGRNGDFFTYLANHRLTEKEARHFMWQLIAGVEHCHSLGVAHRDLKPENLVLDEDLNLKIVDFGSAAPMVDGKVLTQARGSPQYMAPETFYAARTYQGVAADVWSCGIIFYAALCNRLPFDAKCPSEFITQSRRGHVDLHHQLSEDAQDILKKILVASPSKRISIVDIKLHSWFSSNALAQEIEVVTGGFAPQVSGVSEVSTSSGTSGETCPAVRAPASNDAMAVSDDAILPTSLLLKTQQSMLEHSIVGGLVDLVIV